MNLRIKFYILGILILTLFLGFQIIRLLPQDNGKIINRTELPDGKGSLDLLSGPYHLDKIYTSMLGPRGNLPLIQLSVQADDLETIWLTGVESQVVDGQSLEEISNEFFCHANLTLNPITTTPEKHNQLFEPNTHASWRLVTLVPGRMKINLPEGFGIPIKNGTRLDYFTMALNQNPGLPQRTIRMRTKLTYQRQKPKEKRLIPLVMRPVYVYQQHTDKAEGNSHAGHSATDHQGELCADTCANEQKGATPSAFQKIDTRLDSHPGSTCCVGNASSDGIVNQFGTENTVHWLVPPGKHQYRTEVTQQMDLPFDTIVHYVTGHLHPFGKSLKLVEMESGKTIFEISGEHFQDKLGVKLMTEQSFPEGVTLARGKRYELITEYDNITDRPIDAMAILYLYARELEFQNNK